MSDTDILLSQALALVNEDQRGELADGIEAIVTAAVLREREACALVVDAAADTYAAVNAQAVAADLYDALDRALAAIEMIYDEWGRETGKNATRLYDDDPAVVAGLAALAKARGELTP